MIFQREYWTPPNASAIRREVTRLASMANKRIERLERNGFTESPAYQYYLSSGGGKFGVKGKNYNEAQQELSRLNHFLDSTTSTVRGATRVLKDMAKNTGLNYTSVRDLKAKAIQFFRIAGMVDEILRSTEGSSTAVGYHAIWNAINTYVAEARIDLANAENDVVEIASKVAGMTTYEQTIQSTLDGRNSVDVKFQWLE